MDFLFQHGHITSDGRLLIGTNEGGPCIKTHPRVDQRSHFFEFQIIASDSYFVYGSILLTFIADDFRDLGCIDFARLQSRSTGAFGVTRFHVADQIDGRLRLAHQILRACMTHHVHEKDARLVEEEMIVQCGHFETIVEERRHDRIHFILK